MKLKMLTGMSGPKINLTRGDEHEFEDAEAIRLVRAGYASCTSEEDAKSVAEAIAAAEKADAKKAERPATDAEKKAKGKK